MLGRLLSAAVFLTGAGGVSACATGVDVGPEPVVSEVTRGPAEGAGASRDGARVSESATKKSNESTTSTALGGPFFRATADSPLAATSLNTFSRYEAALQSDGTLTIATNKGAPGSDPQPSGYSGGSFYNGGTFRHAAVSSPVWRSATPFDSVTPSFEALTPKGTWLEVRVSARTVATGSWTKDYSLGVWAYDDSTVRRHSVTAQADEDGDVATDTLKLAAPADALYVTVLLFSEDTVNTPVVRAVSAVTTKAEAPPKTAAGNPSLWGKTLQVPRRSQMIYTGGNEGWGAPTSTAMLLGWWGIVESPPDAANKCHDVVYDGTGNGLFNTAHAAAIDEGKLHAIVTRLDSFAQVEPLIATDVPVAIRIAHGSGQLDGAPLATTAGRLIVVKGFTATGDVVVNDPAFASDATVETTYDRAQLTAAWRRSGGTTYLVWPDAKKLPNDPLGGY